MEWAGRTKWYSLRIKSTQGLLMCAGAESPLVSNFCHYHLVLPGFEVRASPLLSSAQLELHPSWTVLSASLLGPRGVQQPQLHRKAVSKALLPPWAVKPCVPIWSEPSPRAAAPEDSVRTYAVPPPTDAWCAWPSHRRAPRTCPHSCCPSLCTSAPPSVATVPLLAGPRVPLLAEPRVKGTLVD